MCVCVCVGPPSFGTGRILVRVDLFCFPRLAPIFSSFRVARNGLGSFFYVSGCLPTSPRLCVCSPLGANSFFGSSPSFPFFVVIILVPFSVCVLRRGCVCVCVCGRWVCGPQVGWSAARKKYKREREKKNSDGVGLQQYKQQLSECLGILKLAIGGNCGPRLNFRMQKYCCAWVPVRRATQAEEFI